MLIALIILVIFLLPVYLFIKSAKKKVTKQKESSWKGRLVNKEHLEYEDDDSAYTKDLYTLYFQTDEGKEIKMNVSQKIYEGWEKGDKAQKTEGERFPKNLHS